MKTLSIGLFFALLAMAATSSAVDLGSPAPATPYERFMSPVRTVLSSVAGKARMSEVKALMRQGREFRYHLDNPYVPAMPEETERYRVGDCKDKSLWLCDRLNDSSVRFVIGKTHRNARMSHAWVMWQNEGRWWILDCTLKSDPIAADTLPADRYVPFYSYGKHSAYRHGAKSARLATVAQGKAARQ